MVSNNNLINCDPEVLSGKPVIKGTRISVAYIIQCLASGMTVEDILKGHPHLTKEGVMAAIEYVARELQGEEIYSFESVK